MQYGIHALTPNEFRMILLCYVAMVLQHRIIQYSCTMHCCNVLSSIVWCRTLKYITAYHSTPWYRRELTTGGHKRIKIRI